MNSILPGVLWCMFGVCAVLDWWALWRGQRVVEKIAKPGAMLALIGVVIASRGLGDTSIRLLLLALVLCLAGDVLLLAQGDGRFLAGLSAFLLGHLAYAVLFLHLGLPSGWWAVAAGVGLLGLLSFGVRIIRAAFGTEGPAGAGLGVGVTAYIAVICVMAVLGWWTGHVWIGLGASIFVVSDTILGWNKFVRALPWGPVAVMVTYLAAQALLVIGVLHG
jgi:uncharacterized membrane protein YhhN